MVHRNGVSPFVFTLSPNGSFSPIVLSSFFPNNPTDFVVCPNFWRPLSFQKRIISPYSGKPVGDSTKTQYYLAIRYGRKGPRMFRYKSFGKWLCYPMRLESRDSGLGYKDIDSLAYPQADYLIIGLFQTLAVFVVLWGLQVIGVFGISVHLPHSQFPSSQIVNQSFYDIDQHRLLYFFPVIEMREVQKSS